MERKRKRGKAKEGKKSKQEVKLKLGIRENKSNTSVCIWGRNMKERYELTGKSSLENTLKLQSEKGRKIQWGTDNIQNC